MDLWFKAQKSPSMYCRFYVFLFLIFFITACAKSEKSIEIKTDCQTMSLQGYDFGFCHESVKGSTSKDVILYFHGLTVTEKAWKNLGFRHEIRYGKHYLKDYPAVVSVSFGSAWFLTDVSYLKKSRLEVFTEDFLPKLNSILGFNAERKILMGESMGGFNVLRLAAYKPQEFDRVVATCPAVMAIGPHDPTSRVIEFLWDKPYVDKLLLMKVMPFAVWEFPTSQDWDNNNPLKLIESSNYRLPPLLITSNQFDEYGFNVGITRLTDKMLARKQPVQVVNEEGRHCYYSSATFEALNNFLSK